MHERGRARFGRGKIACVADDPGGPVDEIVASDQIVADLGDSEDPVARREVVDALFRKAKALTALRRVREKLAVWDELERFVDDPPVGRELLGPVIELNRAMDLARVGERDGALQATGRVLAQTVGLEPPGPGLRLRVRALALRWQILVDSAPSEAAELDAQIIDELGASQEAVARRLVAFALAHRASWLMRAGRDGEALACSQALGRRIGSEPDESLRAVAERALALVDLLCTVAGADIRGVTVSVLFSLANYGDQLCRSGLAWIAGHTPDPIADSFERSPLRHLADGAGRTLTPALLTSRRERIQQGIALARAVIERVGSDEDPELQRIAATATIRARMAEHSLGHPRAVVRTLEDLADGKPPGAAQAFQALAQRRHAGGSLLDQITELSLLRLRADVLGEGDRRIERIAYDDSIESLTGSGRPRLVRVLARLLRPAAPDEP